MTRKKAIEKEFTHLCKLYGFSCYAKFFDDGGFECEGTNWLNSKMIDLCVWIECNIGVNQEGFPVVIIEELT